MFKLELHVQDSKYVPFALTIGSMHQTIQEQVLGPVIGHLEK